MESSGEKSVWLPVAVGVGIAGAVVVVLVAAGTALRQGVGAPRRSYRRGLIAGDSMNASPVLTRALRQLTGIPWDNTAIVGKNSQQIVDQVRGGFRPGEHDVVVVSVGGNDGNRELVWTQRNIEEIARMVRSGGADLVLLTEPPFRSYRGARAEAVRRSEASRSWVLSGVPGVRFVVDLHRVLGGGGASILPRFDGGDGLHPNVAGRTELARTVARAIGYGT